MYLHTKTVHTKTAHAHTRTVHYRGSISRGARHEQKKRRRTPKKPAGPYRAPPLFFWGPAPPFFSSCLAPPENARLGCTLVCRVSLGLPCLSGFAVSLLLCRVSLGMPCLPTSEKTRPRNQAISTRIRKNKATGPRNSYTTL